MERIKQALELARKERIKNGGKVMGSIAKPEKKSQRAEGQDIKYTNTRTVPMPVAELREKRVITEQQNNISDAYRILRTQTLQRLNEKNWNTLAITSPGTGAGKSLTAINLAMSLSREIDNTVLLIDANLRSPKLDKYFDFHTDFGLSDYLLQDKPLDEMLVTPEGVSSFVILPAGRAIANSSEMLSSPKMQRLVEEVKHRYPSRIVIFDLPPLLESSDALAFIPNADATLVVIEDGKTQQAELKQAFELLQGIDVIGTVLNKAYTTDKDHTGLNLKPSWVSWVLSKLTKKSKRPKMSS